MNNKYVPIALGVLLVAAVIVAVVYISKTGGLESDLEAIERQVASQDARQAELEKKIQAAEQKSSQQEQVMADQKKQVESLTARLKEAPSQEEFDAAGQRATGLEAELKRLKAEMTGREKELEALKTENERMKSQKDDLRAAGLTDQNKIKELEANLRKLTDRLNEQTTELQKASDRFDSLKNEKQALQKKLDGTGKSDSKPESYEDRHGSAERPGPNIRTPGPVGSSAGRTQPGAD